MPTSSISMMRPNIEVMCIFKFQYATSAMLALLYDHFLVSFTYIVQIIIRLPWIIRLTLIRAQNCDLYVAKDNWTKKFVTIATSLVIIDRCETMPLKSLF